MEQFLSSIERSLNEENWMSAVYMAICIPDICGAAEEKIKNNGERYKNWFNRYLKWWYDPENFYEQYKVLAPDSVNDLGEFMKSQYEARPALVSFTAEECWALRNACLHQGTDEAKLRNFRITIPEFPGKKTHFNNIKNVLQLDASTFCQDLIREARRWLSDTIDDPVVQKNLQKMMKINHSGFIFGSQS